MVHLQLLPAAPTTPACHLPDGTYSVGRQGAHAILVAHPTVSDPHCELLVYGSEVIVRDKSSRNGTFVNNTPVHGQMGVRNGQRLQIGSVEFLIHIDFQPEEDGGDTSATQAFRKWLHTSESSPVESPRFPVLFIPVSGPDPRK